MSRDSLPVLDPESFPETRDRADATIHGVLLAAGTSSRYGDANKLLEPVEGTPIVRHAATTLLDSSVAAVTVILGHESERVREAVADLPVSVKKNPSYAQGQSTSVRAGITAAREQNADASLVALGDMPRIDPASLDTVIEAYVCGVADIVAAAYEGQRGNPVLFDSRFFSALIDVDGDTGGRDLLLESSAAVAVETGDSGVLQDVDRPDDLPEEQ